MTKGLAALLCAFSLAAGLYIGVAFLAPALTQHHYTERIIEKPVVVEGEAQAVAHTQVAYVPKEVVVVEYVDPVSGQETAREELEKADIDAQIGKQEIYVRLNGRDVVFEKADEERFVLEKNKIVLNQSGIVLFEARVEVPVVDKTKRWSIGIGYGNHGLAGKLDFPMGRIGGWLYGDKKTAAGGLQIRF